jgi:hypothetical protein
MLPQMSVCSRSDSNNQRRIWHKAFSAGSHNCQHKSFYTVPACTRLSDRCHHMQHALLVAQKVLAVHNLQDLIRSQLASPGLPQYTHAHDWLKRVTLMQHHDVLLVAVCDL